MVLRTLLHLRNDDGSVAGALFPLWDIREKLPSTSDPRVERRRHLILTAQSLGQRSMPGKSRLRWQPEKISCSKAI